MLAVLKNYESKGLFDTLIIAWCLFKFTLLNIRSILSNVSNAVASDGLDDFFDG